MPYWNAQRFSECSDILKDTQRFSELAGVDITLGPTPSEIQRGKLEFLTFLDFNRLFWVYKDIQRVYKCDKKLKSLKNDMESLGFEPLT